MHFANFDLSDEGHWNLATIITEKVLNDFINPALKIYAKGEYGTGIDYSLACVKDDNEYENDEEA